MTLKISTTAYRLMFQKVRRNRASSGLDRSRAVPFHTSHREASASMAMAVLEPTAPKQGMKAQEQAVAAIQVKERRAL